jgi:hypothetical protein
MVAQTRTSIPKIPVGKATYVLRENQRLIDRPAFAEMDAG